MKAAVKARGGKISDIFFCPHMPSDGCDCRKPAPGMIFQAQKKYDIDLPAAVMIGDSARDIECAHNAGCGHTVLVETGNGKAAAPVIAEMDLLTDYVAQDLYDAAQWAISSLS
jgi:D-glycero-D-manno-heptose 1,7-bisphosphate phosphatase